MLFARDEPQFMLVRHVGVIEAELNVFRKADFSFLPSELHVFPHQRKGTATASFHRMHHVFERCGLVFDHASLSRAKAVFDESTTLLTATAVSVFSAGATSTD